MVPASGPVRPPLRHAPLHDLAGQCDARLPPDGPRV